MGTGANAHQKSHKELCDFSDKIITTELPKSRVQSRSGRLLPVNTSRAAVATGTGERLRDELAKRSRTSEQHRLTPVSFEKGLDCGNGASCASDAEADGPAFPDHPPTLS